MKKFLRRSFALLPGLMVVAFTAQPLCAKSDSEQVGLSVGRLLEEGHYTHHPLDDEISRKLLTGYLEILDFSHLFFTQKDVDAFTKKYATMLDDDILLGNLKPAHEIFDVFQKRVEDRVKKIKELVKQPMDFKTNETVLLSRQKAPWPKDEAEADDLWRKRIEN
jgi:carboxyl-terminal processing protease